MLWLARPGGYPEFVAVPDQNSGGAVLDAAS
jgi:hypothetical protein